MIAYSSDSLLSVWLSAMAEFHRGQVGGRGGGTGNVAWDWKGHGLGRSTQIIRKHRKRGKTTYALTRNFLSLASAAEIRRAEIILAKVKAGRARRERETAEEKKKRAENKGERRRMANNRKGLDRLREKWRKRAEAEDQRKGENCWEEDAEELFRNERKEHEHAVEREVKWEESEPEVAEEWQEMQEEEEQEERIVRFARPVPFARGGVIYHPDELSDSDEDSDPYSRCGIFGSKKRKVVEVAHPVKDNADTMTAVDWILLFRIQKCAENKQKGGKKGKRQSHNTRPVSEVWVSVQNLLQSVSPGSVTSHLKKEKFDDFIELISSEVTSDQKNSDLVRLRSYLRPPQAQSVFRHFDVRQVGPMGLSINDITP